PLHLRRRTLDGRCIQARRDRSGHAQRLARERAGVDRAGRFARDGRSCARNVIVGGAGQRRASRDRAARLRARRHLCQAIAGEARHVECIATAHGDEPRRARSAEPGGAAAMPAGHRVSVGRRFRTARKSTGDVSRGLAQTHRVSGRDRERARQREEPGAAGGAAIRKGARRVPALGLRRAGALTMLLDHAETVALALSFKIALVGVVCSLPVAIGCAWLLARKRFFGKPLFEGLLLLPLILPPVVTGYILLIVFGHHGAIGRWLDAAGLSIAFRWTGAALAAAVMAFPLLVVALRNAFESV